MYDKEKLKPGYTGKFVIQHHFSRNEHFDLRLQFPVESIAKSLADYSDKRPKKGVEPTPSTPDKPGNVLRSWAVPKHRIPEHKPLLATETENHAMEYASFNKTIPEGQYGAGTVEIFDRGTYTIDRLEYDKKYVFTMHGKKVKGQFALIKTGRKSFLWLKTKGEKKACISEYLRRIASGIDYVRPTMIPEIWDLSQDPPMLKSGVKAHTLETLKNSLVKNGLSDPMRWIGKLFISGSSTSYNYKEDGDFDVDVEYDSDKIRKLYSNLAKKDGEELKNHVQTILDKNRSIAIPGTKITYSFMLLEQRDLPGSDGIYDLIENRWIKGPIKIPLDFDPDIAFSKQKKIAGQIVEEIYRIIGDIKIVVKDLKRIDQYIKNYDRMEPKRVIAVLHLQNLCMNLAGWRKDMWRMHDKAKQDIHPIYPAFNYGSDWDEKYIIFKYIARYGCHEPVEYLYTFFDEDDPYLEMIKKIMPADSVGRFYAPKP